MRSRGVAALFERRESPLVGVEQDAETVARTCRAMAARFRRGGKLIVFGNGSAAADAQHISVEFVHPVIVGKKALPAIALASDVASLTGLANQRGFAEAYAHQIGVLAEPNDIALGVSADGNCQNVLFGLLTARRLGLLTVALAGGEGGAFARSGVIDHLLLARSEDPRVVKEAQVTTYHVLWELTHVFLEQQPTRSPAPIAVGVAECHEDVCVTCADEAIPVTVTRLFGDGMAVVDTGRGAEEVSVALVSAEVGDTVLVHAKEAIAVLPPSGGGR
ncbi:MAG: SIS domain-containing protein [Micromonosporaceae bacterium]